MTAVGGRWIGRRASRRTTPEAPRTYGGGRPIRRQYATQADLNRKRSTADRFLSCRIETKGVGIKQEGTITRVMVFHIVVYPGEKCKTFFLTDYGKLAFACINVTAMP